MGREKGLRAFQNARLRKQRQADPDAEFARALALHQTGRAADARLLYRDLLQRHPRHFDALHFLAVAEMQHGRLEEADRLFRQALAINPSSAPLHSNRSVVLYDLRRFEEAVASCDRALALKPDYAEALCNRANALRSLDRPEDALASAERAIALRPNYAEAFDVRGSALFMLRRHDEAVASFDRAIGLRPRYREALSNRGGALTELLRYDAAIASFDQALAIDPKSVDAIIGRANALLLSGRAADAAAECRRALALAPDSPSALAVLGQCYEKLADLDRAIACYDRALAIMPDFDCALSNRIFALDFDPQADFAKHQAARADWWRHVGAKIAATCRPSHANDLDPARRLVLGYVSSDFKSHSAAFTFGPAVRNHDKSRFELICYHCAPFEDHITREFQAIADQWRDASRWPDARIAEQIQADKVDILIDLSGHTKGHRLGVFARKPAPIQVTAWGHNTGTGLPTIDYLFADPVSVPYEVRHLFAEKIYDLPCVLASDPAPRSLRPVDPPLLSNGHVTFGVFNRISKISDEAIEIWSRILGATMPSRLKIKHRALDDPAVRQALVAKFAQHGIAADRVDFHGTTSREDHLRALNQVDICFDPFPQNGGVSTWEALQMGVPVVAKLGNSIVSRLSGSILASIGLADWAGESSDDYVEIALRFAAMPDYLRELRHTLPDRIAASPAGDNQAFARSVEHAYRTMWQDYCGRVARAATPPAA
jgi:predicted O-linked N-acetylglucosamine transferase (SPINDLY family)